MGVPLLEARSISKAFAGVHALKDVSFELRAGEVHALIGENGAGKSTLTEDHHRRPHRRLRSAGSSRTSGRATTIPAGAVARNRGHLSTAGIVPGSERRREHRVGARRPVSVATRYGRSAIAGRRIHDSSSRRRNRPGAPGRTLSMPEQQIVEIAKAIGAKAKILIMDEPTASLTDREVDACSASSPHCATRARASSISRTVWTKSSRSRTASPSCATAKPSRRVATRPSRTAKNSSELMVGREIVGRVSEARGTSRRSRARAAEYSQPRGRA